MATNNKPPTAENKLATAVIMQAVQDIVRPTAINPDQKNAARRDAEGFLFDDERAEDLKAWAEAADWPIDNVRKLITHVKDNNVDIAKLQQELEQAEGSQNGEL